MNKKPICTKDCENYHSGGLGERYCSFGNFDERSQHNKPMLDENYSVVIPSMCPKSKYGFKKNPYRGY